MSYQASAQKKVLMLIGTRPEAIKMAPVYHALSADARFQVRIVSTGQHGELLHQALEAFGIELDGDLKMMEPGQSLTRLVGRSLVALDELLKEEQPDQVLVHGDTATGFAGALACFYAHIPCAHVEAGLRSYRLDSPFPEEFHRQVVAKAVSLHFAPTEEAKRNLLADGIEESQIVVTGNTAVDAVVSVLGPVSETPKNSQTKIKKILITAHRRENGGTGFTNILSAIRTLTESFPDHEFIFPTHPNPAVQRALASLPSHSNLRLTQPMPYDQFLPLLAEADLILTDSGGIQEEAAFLGRKVLLLRETTERPEALSCGSAKLVGTDADAIVEAARQILLDKAEACGDNPFGAPGASLKIADRLGLSVAQLCEVAA